MLVVVMIHLLLLPDWWLASSARRSKPILASKASYNACTILAGSKLPIMQKCVKDSRESMQENLLPLAYSFCLLQQMLPTKTNKDLLGCG